MVKFYRLPDVLEAVGVSRSTLDRWIKSGKFPPPVKLNPDGGRSVAWSADDIEAWQDARLRDGREDAA